MHVKVLGALAALIVLPSALISLGSPVHASAATLADRLTGIRSHVVDLESSILDALKSQKKARANVQKIQKLLALQREERELGKKRLGELEAKVLELETRRGTLAETIKKRQADVRRSLLALERSAQEGDLRAYATHESEKTEAPRRKTLANLSDRGLKEVEALKVDLVDAEQLENRIQDEKQQLAYLFQDLQEQASVLELNRQLQVELIQKKHDERIAQLESYRKLKTSEQQVEQLIGQFNSRLELERQTEAERQTSRAVSPNAGTFARLKGSLGWPVADGKVVSIFGRNFDPKSRLFIFKKGVDIAAAKYAGVRAISTGKVAYSGELPEYGRVTIIDHGEHYYSICAHLGELKKKAGDEVKAGDLIGLTDESGTPVYFEIRARNVAVNPLQWVSNELILSK